MINKNLLKRDGIIHLYNPKNEGPGSYDKNYINAYKKNVYIKNNVQKIYDERYAA